MNSSELATALEQHPDLMAQVEGLIAQAEKDRQLNWLAGEVSKAVGALSGWLNLVTPLRDRRLIVIWDQNGTVQWRLGHYRRTKPEKGTALRADRQTRPTYNGVVYESVGALAEAMGGPPPGWRAPAKTWLSRNKFVEFNELHPLIALAKVKSGELEVAWGNCLTGNGDNGTGKD